jgi:hypothetical protein
MAEPNYHVDVFAAPGVEPTALRAALVRAAPALDLHPADRLDDEAEAVVYLAGPEDDPAALAEFTSRLLAGLAARGKACAVGQVPVLAVVTGADRLARPGDGYGDWLERLEAAKTSLGRHLHRLAIAGDGRPGFGSPRWHVWATAPRRPAITGPAAADQPFGVAELAHQLVAEAAAYRRRRRRQPWRTLALVGFLALVVLGLLGGATALILTDVSGWVAVWAAPPPAPPPDPTAEARTWLDRGDRLLRFEGFLAAAPAGVNWPAWAAEVDDHLRAGEALVPRLAAAPPAAEAITSLAEALRTLRRRAALLHLAAALDELPPLLAVEPDPDPKTPLSIGELRDRERRRLDRLRLLPPAALQTDLPDRVPVAAARELQATARASYDRLLDPVRQELRRRVREGGTETPEAWQAVLTGWLLGPAPVELAEWREVALLLQRLGGRQEADPLTELQTFLRQEVISLPLEQLELVLPETVPWPEPPGAPVAGLRPAGPLLIRLRPVRGTEQTVTLTQESGTVPGRPHAVPFRAAPGSLREGRLPFRPGDVVSASLAVRDGQGRSWTLTWPAAEARSAVYSFDSLSQAPRLHRPEVTDPTKGVVAFGVHLDFADPRAFRLPDLMPR